MFMADALWVVATGSSMNRERKMSGMDDLISRQAAIDAICEHGTDLERRGITVIAVVYHKQATVDLLENLPSAERRGRWVGERLIYPSGIITFIYRCSECGCEERHAYEDTKPSNYCPNCGAQMEASE